MKYALYINGVCYDYFKTIKEIDTYLYEIDISLKAEELIISRSDKGRK